MPLLATYLRGFLSYSTDQVKIVDVETFEKEYNTPLLQGGILLNLTGPRPHVQPYSGSGNSGMLVTRTLRVMAVTCNNSDPAGRNEVALGLHWTVEDNIIYALNNYMGSGATSITKGVSSLQLMDGSGAEFMLKYQNSKYLSIIPWAVTYVGLTLGPGCTG